MELPTSIALLVLAPVAVVGLRMVASRLTRPPLARTATRMKLAFELVEGEKEVARDELVMTSEESSRSYVAEAGRTITLTFAFGRPSCTLAIASEDHYEVALAIGVHQSKDWESVAIGDVAKLRYRCTPLP